ncbi:MAG: DNA cytosine methyltransferase [Clostridia bacterium]|nr:DNA cytosine methyltransferase [Clostridia bacterium]
MKLLVACEESQTVCKAFREIGWEAYSCDIIECSGGHPEWHIQGDALPLINGNCKFKTADGVEHTVDGKWDLLIAHPPCTYMSKAGARFMYPTAGNIDENRLKKALEAKDFFMKFLNADCERICVENPTPLKCVGLPKESQVVQPFEYGHPFSKRTLLWQKGLSPLKPTKIVDEYKPYLPSNTGGFARGKGGSRGVAHNAKDASKTFEGIAKAMAEQWGKDCQ